MNAPHRFELTESERVELARIRSQPLGITGAARLIICNPRLLLEAVTSLVRSARNSFFQDSALVWLIDSERIRRTISSDLARGVAFADEEPFIMALRPFLGKSDAVLELGCGDGRISRLVAPRVAALTCSDVSGLMIREARRNLAGFKNTNVVRTCGVALQEFEDDSFDVVFAQGVFSYLEMNQTLALLDASRRVLRPGGTLVVNFFTIDRPEWLDLLLPALRRAAESDRFNAGLFRPYTGGYVRDIVEAAGFTEVHGRYPRGGTAREPYVVSGSK